jgi:hypothetical protein
MSLWQACAQMELAPSGRGLEPIERYDPHALFRLDQDMLVSHSSLHPPPRHPTRAWPPRHCVATMLFSDKAKRLWRLV